MINAGINIRDDLLYKEESGKVIEACKEVYKEFGGSFKESIVDKAIMDWESCTGI